jgi:drug/metabolite transporter (DMT)-like permease
MSILRFFLTFFSHERPLTQRYLMGALLVFTGALFFSFKAILAKKAFELGATPLTLLTLRMSFAAPFFLLSLWYSYKFLPLPYRPDPHDYVMAIFLGTLGYYGSSLLDFIGLQYVSVALERLTLFLYPSFVLVFSYFFLHTPISLGHIRALIITYIGLVLAFSAELQLSTTPGKTFLGTGLVIISAIIYALYLMGNGVYVRRIGSIRFTAIAMLSACAAGLLHYNIAYEAVSVTNLSLPIYGYAFLIAFFSTVLPAFMVSAGIRLIGAGPASIISSVGPASSILLGAWLLSEPFTWLQGTGVIAVIIGVVSMKIDKESQRDTLN